MLNSAFFQTTFKWAGWALFVYLFVTIFLWGAKIQSEKINVNMERSDQSAYMYYAKQIKLTNYEFVGGRNRMPLYPLIMSHFYKEGMNDVDFFKLGKRINVIIALAVILIVFIVFKLYCNTLDTLAATLITAFTIFVYKAPYFQVELFFYGLTFVFFLLLIKLIQSPKLGTAVAAGIVAAIAHLSKGSILPAIWLLTLCFSLKVIYSLIRLIKKEKSEELSGYDFKNQIIRYLTVFFVFIVVFLVVVFPYIRTSKAVFGQYFYNVNSTFYLWYDSFEEAKKGTKAHGDRVGWPHMPEDQIPSLKKYLRDHTKKQIWGRIIWGLKNVKIVAFESYGYHVFIITYLIFLLLLIIQNSKIFIPLIKDRLLLAFFIVSYFSGYIVAYAWFSALMDCNRTILALFLPMMFVFQRIITFGRLRELKIKVFSETIPSGKINHYILALLMGYVIFAFPLNVYLKYGGS